MLIDGDVYDRQPLLPREGYPGVHYARRADTGGLRLSVRVDLVECGGCGRPLKLVMEKVDGKDVKIYRCGTPDCNRTWHPTLVREAGGPQLLAMVMKSH